MSVSHPQREEAIGVECAWPAPEFPTANRRPVRNGDSKLRRNAWRAIATVIVVSLLTVGGWGLTGSASDIATVLPSGIPTHTE